MSPLIRRLSLLLLLVCAQIAQAAHELDFDVHLNGDDHCLVCLAGHGLNAPPVHAALGVPAQRFQTRPMATPVAGVASSCPITERARAPPPTA